MAFIAAIHVIALALSINGALSMECGYHTTSLKGTIKGPLESNSSPQMKVFRCVWTITVPELNRIKLEFQVGDIPGNVGGKCTDDWILIESPRAKGSSTLNGLYCGSSLEGRKTTSTENQIRIEYLYNNHYYDKKSSYFTLKYEAVPLNTSEIATHWIEKEMKKDNLPKTVSSLFLVNEDYFQPSNLKAENVTNEFRLKLGEDLVRNFTRPMSAGDVAVRISALMAACVNPRSFYGLDLVTYLRTLVNNVTGIPNPYFLLTLCNSGDKLISHDIKILEEIIDTQKHHMFWLDYQAMALLALVCAREQNEHHHLKNKIDKAITEIKSFQLADGGFGSIDTTSLVIQALKAAEANDSGWKRSAAIAFINKAKQPDGSFGNIHNLYAVAPVISDKTLLYINASKCDFTNDDSDVGEIRANLTQPINILYSIWIGDHVDVSSTMPLTAPNGTKFLDFMRLAADKDEKFKFRWINVKNSPYINEIGGLINDPSSGKYWTLYTGKQPENIEPFNKGLEHYIPKNADFAVMWYKTVSV